MNFIKMICCLILVTLLTCFIACGDTLSSSDDDLNYIPGFNPNKEKDSTSTKESSDSQNESSNSNSIASSTQAYSSEATPEESSSSSSERIVDFSNSKIDVDEGGIAEISQEFLEEISSSKKNELTDLLLQIENNEEPVGFEELKNTFYSVDDLNFDSYSYFCYTDEELWLGITKEKLQETNLPFLWNGEAYDLRNNYTLTFENTCHTIYKQSL